MGNSGEFLLENTGNSEALWLATLLTVAAGGSTEATCRLVQTFPAFKSSPPRGLIK